MAAAAPDNILHQFWTRSALLALPQRQLPALVLSDDLYGRGGATIRSHSHGYYTHAFWAFEEGCYPLGPRCASQDQPLFREVALHNYLQGRHRLKLWGGPWLAHPEQAARLRRHILAQLNDPWYKRLYDWPGCATESRWLKPLHRVNIPWLKFCSERDADDLRWLRQVFPATYAVEPPYKPSPGELNAWLKTQPDFAVIARYDPEIQA